MKLLKRITLLVLITFSNCTAQVETNSNLEIIYTAQTRGSSYVIKYDGLNIECKSNTEHKKIVLSKQQQEVVEYEVSKIKLTEIKDLVAPTSKRYSDGALSGKFVITKDEKKFTSSGFDHKNPPDDLKKLYLILEDIIK